MKFLLDANLPRSTAGLLKNLGHEVHDVLDVLPGGADDDSVAAHARTHQLTLITRDFDFADIRNYPPHEFQGILVLRMPDDSVAQTIVNLLERFLKQTELAARLPGHLVILEPDRVRFRPALQ